MDLILFIVFWFIGLMVTSFTIIPVFIILFFGIPTTNMLEKKGILKHNNGIKRGYMLNVIVFPIVYVGIFWAISRFFPNGLIGFLIGSGMSLLFELGQVGRNKNNVSDYYETNKRHFTASHDEVLEALWR